MRRVHSYLIAAAHARQAEAAVRADAAAEAADRAVRRVWQRALAFLKKDESWILGERAKMGLVFGGLFAETKAEVSRSLHKIAAWGWRSAARSVVAHVPRRLLAAAVVLRRGNGPNYAGDRRGVPESVAGDSDRGSCFRPGLAQTRPLTEDEGADAPAVDWLDLLFPHRSGENHLTDADWQALLFPPPAEENVARVVYSSGWVDRITAGTRLGNPQQLAGLLTTGLALGKSHQEIARDLLPHVDGVRSTARRVARTEALRVAGAMQQHAHDQLGDLVVGYQVHSTSNPHTRPWHQHRSGTIYWLEPKPGQKGPAQMPHPPEEAEDENERPIINGKRAPKVAQNCLCFNTPVLTDPGADMRRQLDALGEAPTADAGMMDDWFDRADAKRRRYVVGARRYNAAKEVLGRAPAWHEMMATDGRLLTADELRAETPGAREARVAAAKAIVDANREALRQARSYGAAVG